MCKDVLCHNHEMTTDLYKNDLFHVFVLFLTDYLNNLSPDSKEYTDTQGKYHWICINIFLHALM